MSDHTPYIGLTGRTPVELKNYASELDELQSYGVNSVEIGIYDMDLIVGCKIRKDRVATLRSTLSGRKLNYSVHGPLSINLMDEPWRLPRHMDVLRAALDVAAELGAENYVVHGGILKQQQSAGIEEGYARQRDMLASIADVAQSHGLYICVETMFAGYSGDNVTAAPSRLARELAMVDHPHICATLDVSHAYLKVCYDGREAEFLEEMRLISPWARHVHMHDSFGRQDDIWMYNDSERVIYGHGDLHLPMGWGNIPWESIIEICEFPEGVVFNLEMKPRFWYAVQESVDIARDFADRARVIDPLLKSQRTEQVSIFAHT